MKQGCTEIDGKFYQECDIVMLPTKEASKLYDLYGKLNISLHGDIYQNDGDKVPQHLYFLSDEETRSEICWHYNHILKTISNEVSTGYKKIIATTDSNLNLDKRYKDGGEIVYLLPRPSNSFIDKFVSEWNKGNKIEKVLVEMFDDGEEEWMGDDYIHYGEPFWNSHYNLKIAPDNTITIKSVEVSKFEQLAQLLRDRGVRKYLNINNFGYSLVERDIVELLSKPVKMEESWSDIVKEYNYERIYYLGKEGILRWMERKFKPLFEQNL